MIAERSLSSRLTISFSSVLFVGLILFGAVIWFDFENTLLTGRSRTLDRRADRLGELLLAIQPGASRSTPVSFKLSRKRPEAA
jgi:hypothetical protein